MSHWSSSIWLLWSMWLLWMYRSNSSFEQTRLPSHFCPSSDLVKPKRVAMTKHIFWLSQSFGAIPHKSWASSSRWPAALLSTLYYHSDIQQGNFYNIKICKQSLVHYQPFLDPAGRSVLSEPLKSGEQIMWTNYMNETFQWTNWCDSCQ